MLESPIEKEFRKQAKQAGWWPLKLKVISHAGFPDRLLLKKPGQIKFVELKATGKKPRKLQKWVMNKLKELGFECHVIDSVETIDSVIQD